MIRIPHLETDVTQACQFSCVGCNHFVPLWRRVGPWSANPDQVRRDLTTLSRYVHADAWGALGGEPTLHPDLCGILAIARKSGVADKIEVWTNGARLRSMPEHFWAAFDRLVLSIYPCPEKQPQSLIDWVHARCMKAGVELVIKDERADRNFRTLLSEEGYAGADPTVVSQRYAHCFFRSFSRAASYGRFFTCCVAPHLPFLVLGMPFGTDGIPIDDTLTEERIAAYLDNSMPLTSCRACAGRDTAQPLTWRQQRDPQAWIAASRYGDTEVRTHG